MQTNSFFTVLESRIDRIFFRIRLLPTIFACHQFIHYNGLEINNKLEKSPRKEVKIGDIITVPSSAWIAFYWHVYYRIYYRRWGRYIFKRRIIKKIKKKLYFNFQIKPNHFRKKVLYYFKKNSLYKSKFYTNKIFNLKSFFFDYILKNNNVKVIESENVNIIIVKNYINFMKKLTDMILCLKKKLDSIEDKRYKKKELIKMEKLNQLFIKINQYKKLYFNSYFFSIWKQKKTIRYMSNQQFFKKNQKSLIRLFWKKVKKQKRNKTVIRLKPVHFFIPKYLQIDFRTLSAIKMKSPQYSDIHYPFQISLSKTYSFYKNQGF